jgi:L-alanine-DL-glutamate epimerase-like enolase superfamily enzyme
MLFGLESIKPTPCPQTPTSIPINGLVWMGTFEEMHQRIEEKLAAGFHCVKLKIGAIDWDREIALIRFIRERYSREQIELRVDANGGFSVDEAMSRLEELAKYDIHSIEQPIRQHQWAEMASLCQHSPLPIALDEELIGVNDPEEKVRLLDTIRPQYIILKPSLHGGMRGSEEWIRLARERGIGSWITSALESNIGLYAIARFTMKMYGPDITMPQGLGTGQLFTDNIELPDVEMRIEQGRLVVASRR